MTRKWVRILSPVGKRLQLRRACSDELLRLMRNRAPRVHLRTLAVNDNG